MNKNSLIHNSFIISPWMSVVLGLKGVDLIVFSVVYSISKTGTSEYFGGTKYINSTFNIHKSSILESFSKLTEKGYIVKVENFVNSISIPKYYANIKNIDGMIDKYIEDHPSENPTHPSENPTVPIGKSDHNNINNNLNNNKDIHMPTNLFGNDDLKDVKVNEIGEILKLYNNRFNNILPSIIKITGKREKAVNSILKDFSIDKIREAFDLVMQSDFLKGKTERKFACNFDWIFNSENFVKILENKYKNRQDIISEETQGLSKHEQIINGKRTYTFGETRRNIPDDAPPRMGDCYFWSESEKEWKYYHQ